MPSYVITGANRGIGLEFVQQLSAKADNVVFALVRSTSAVDGLTALQESRKNIHIITGDITEAATLEEAAAQVAKVTGGTLDVLINNAALVTDLGWPLDKHPGGEAGLEHDYIEAFRVNVVGTLHATDAFLPLVRRAAAAYKEGDFMPKVITLGSGVSDQKFIVATGLELIGPYTVSKAGQVALVAKYAATFEKENIIFLTISPGMVNTATKPPTDDELKSVLRIIESFKRAVPEWNGVPIAPEESVRSMLGVFDKLTKADNGEFVSHKGNQEWL